ncbi:helix-turn-helix transcriptional regulator [Streptomyces bambusae]|uniref:helix-turn-helix domain-containing protein n=1 Tax=Streptomyces bambusae TaxID=1550616 RepID=UPI001CFF65BC|nr:helix-turn-helix transcriptional regulator [Streptomyces bambusae]MCB5169582.1 helix-turn-helix transcriptional regulator [Streptomyces bambusae]
MAVGYTPVEVPGWAWERAQVRQVLRARDVGAVFRFVQQYTGASQARIATATGMTQGRVNEIINGKREVSRLDVFERIADGLRLPDDARHLLGLAASRERRVGGVAFDLTAFPESSASTPPRHPRRTKSSSRPELLRNWTSSPSAGLA